MDDIKALWRQDDNSDPIKSAEDLEGIIRGKARKNFLRVARKLVLESLAYCALLVVCFTGMDAHLNRAEVNGFLVLVIALGIGNNVAALLAASPRWEERSLQESLTQVASGFQKQRMISSLFTVCYFCAIFLFLLARTHLSSLKVFETVCLVGGSIGIRLWFENRLWSRRIREVETLLGSFRQA